MEGIEDALHAAQISVFLCNAADNAQLEQQHINSLLSKRVDGIIVTSRRTDPRPPIDLGGAQVPILYAYAQVKHPGVLCLLPDDYGGGRQATEHLVRLGRTRIAHITGPLRFEAVQLRRSAWEDTLKQAGLPATAVLHGTWSEAWGVTAVDELLARYPATDAIFCGSDQIARGVADALRERQIQVPAKIALMGYDNWDIIAAATRPALSTVDMNLHELGKTAGSKLLELISGHQKMGILRLPTRLVIRDSCGASALSPPSV
jgi:LacI family transcriptional regulator